jgi:hypothetical protein
LHTRTGFIGRRDLDVTLATLRLDEEEADGYVDIYAVCRFLEPGISNFADVAEIGTSRESLFRVSASWVHTLTPTGLNINNRKYLHHSK